MQHTNGILYYHYEKIDLHKVPPVNKHLTEEEITTINNIWTKYDFPFDRTLSTFNNKLIYMELQPETNPHHQKSYPEPTSYG